MDAAKLEWMNRMDELEDMAGRTSKWLYETIGAMVDDEMAVSIEKDVQIERVTFVVSVAREDVGKIIGKQGRTAKALRTLLLARAGKDGAAYSLNISEVASDELAADETMAEAGAR